jgi:hypothetical protein
MAEFKFNVNHLKSTKAQLRAKFDVIGMLVKSHAELNAAVDTGLMRASYEYKVRTIDGNVGVRVSNSIAYFLFVELGTVKMDARETLVPAVEENHDKIQGILKI